MVDSTFLCKKYIQTDKSGNYLILKINDQKTLESMYDGEFWFRHPAYFNYCENEHFDSERGDKDDDKYSSVCTNLLNAPEGAINFDYNGANIKNLECDITIRVFTEKEQDKDRQISFYKLMIDNDGNYSNIDKRLEKFGNSFALVNIVDILKCLNTKDFLVEKNDCCYYYENYSGEMNTFFKKRRYKYQNEHRISLISDKFKDVIEKDVEIQKENRQNDKCCNMVQNARTCDAKIFASDMLKKSENRIENLKSHHKEIIKLEKRLLSKPMPLSLLFQVATIYEWEEPKWLTKN